MNARDEIMNLIVKFRRRFAVYTCSNSAVHEKWPYIKIRKAFGIYDERGVATDLIIWIGWRKWFAQIFMPFGGEQ